MTTNNLESKELLVRSFIQFEDIYDRLHNHLPYDTFSDSQDIHLKIILRSLSEYRERYKKQPTFEELKAFVVDSIPETFDPSILHSVHLFFEVPPLSEQPNEEFLDSIVSSIKLETEKRRLASGLSSVNGNPDALLQLLEGSIQRLKLRPSSILDAAVEFPDDPLEFCQEGQRFKYGISFLDNFLGGGSEKPEANLLIAPTGVGKTMFGLFICSSWVEQATLNEGLDDPGLAVFVTYELGAKPLMKRLICQTSHIEVDKLEAYLRGVLSQSDFRAEMDRYRRAKENLNKHFRLANFSGEDVNGKKFGFGGINEVVNFLGELQNKTNRPIGLVVLDWVEAAIKKTTPSVRVDSTSAHSLEISQFVINACDKIAKGFNCVLWLIHQVAGANSKKGTGHIFHHTDASWSKNMAQYVDFAFSLSNPDPNGGMIFTCTKHRRTFRRNPVYLKITKTLRFKQEQKTLIFEDLGKVTIAEEIKDESAQ